MTDGLFLAGIVLLGFLPAATVFLGRRKLSLRVCLGWLALAGAALLRPAANDPHPFGLALFLIFLLGWIAALVVVLSPAVASRFRRLTK